MSASKGDETGVTGRRLDRLPGPARRLFETDTDQYDRLFTLILTVYIGALLVMTLGYRDEAQLVPFVIGVPTFVLLLSVLAIQTSDRVATLADKLSDTDVFGVGTEGPPVGDTADEVDSTEELDTGEVRLLQARFGLLKSTVIVLSLVALIYVAGFYVGIFIFLVGVYRLHAGLSWPRTLAVTVAVWLFVIAVFYVALNARLYTGLLDIGLAGIL